MTALKLSAFIILAACSGEKSIRVHNSAPGASITSPTDGMEYIAGQPIEFTGFVNDAQTPNDELIITWDTDKNGLLTDEALADGDGITRFTTTDLMPNEVHSVTLRVVDGGGKSTTDTVVITIGDEPVLERQEPKVTILAPHPSGSDSPWEAEEAFPLEALVNDLQDLPTELTVSIHIVNEDGDILERICTTTPSVEEDDDTDGYALCEATLTSGTHFLLFSAEDTDGNVGFDTGELTVQSGDEVDDDGDGFNELEGDCDDADSAVHPLATEVCDGIDNDCSGGTDGEDAIDAVTYYADVDGDGYGDRTERLTACETPGGYVSDNTDCNDLEDRAYPSATESCDGVDNNCDGFIDEEGATGCAMWYQDADDDGYGSTIGVCACSATGDFTSTLNSDCYDLSSTVNPTHTSFHTSDRGDGSYDYNCDDTEEREETATSDSCAYFDDLGCSSPDGWAGSAPSCGSSGTWRTGCHYVWDWFSSGCYWTTEDTQTQACR